MSTFIKTSQQVQEKKLKGWQLQGGQEQQDQDRADKGSLVVKKKQVPQNIVLNWGAINRKVAEIKICLILLQMGSVYQRVLADCKWFDQKGKRQTGCLKCLILS